MTELVYLENVQYDSNTVLTVGTFDGVHKGHQALIQKVVKKAKMRKGRSVIVTFDPHPREIIDPATRGIKLLTTLEERRYRMATLGVDIMLVIPFTRDFSLKTSDEFIRHDLYEQIGIGEFIIGYDHHFGKDRKGSIETVKNLGAELNFETYVVSKKEVDDTTVSSTKIRKLLTEEGDVKQAATLLGWCYSLQGMVVQGRKRGKELGFPTANIVPGSSKKAIPSTGVYAVKVYLNEERYAGMMNIGYRPTFKDGDEKSLEVHLLDFNEDIYGKSLKIEFIDKIRSEKPFKSKEELINQLKQDKKIARKIIM